MKKTKLALLLIAALLTGVCIGFSVNSAIIRARIQKFSQLPANMPEHITGKLTERLKLDATQQEQVRSVLLTYDSRMTDTREQSRALFASLLEEMTGEIDQYLSPEQREEHKKMLAELDERHRDSRALMRAFPTPASTNAGK